MKRENLLFFLFPLSQGLLLLGFYRTFGQLQGGAYIGTAIGVLADLVLLYILIHNAKQEKIERELEELKYLRKAEQLQKEMLEERQKVLRSMKETFGRQLQEICVQLDQGDLKEARQGAEIMQEELNRTKTEQYCSNPIVNAVLSEKESVCRELGFSMDIQVQIPKGVEVAPLHLCSIFSNLLDNAIEAVRELEQGKRIIEVSGGLKGYYLLVKVSNTAREAHVGRKKRKGRGFKKG